MKKVGENIIACFLSSFLFINFISCKKEQVINLPVERITIYEYKYLNEDEWQFKIIGFSELNKDFLLNYYIYGDFGSYFTNSNVEINDSLKGGISNIILNYPSDTSFIYKKGSRIYDGNLYRLEIERENNEKVVINFIPRLLPDDLFFLYNDLYDKKRNVKIMDSQENKKQKEINLDSYELEFLRLENEIRTEIISH